MRTSMIKYSTLSLSAMLLFAACKKEIANDSLFSASTADQACPDAHQSSCLLVRTKEPDGDTHWFYYNNRGLLSKWLSEGFGHHDAFTVNYDNENKISTARYTFYSGTTYRIKPVYKKGLIMKETWYLGETNFVDDIVVNTYNNKGQIIKRESLNYDTYTSFKYDADGNVLKSIVAGSSDNVVFWSITYFYANHIKNPMLAVHGIPYALSYIDWMFSPLRYSAWKVEQGDGNGNLVPIIDQNPDKSILKPGAGNYAVYQSTFDNITGFTDVQRWHYKDCDGDRENQKDVDLIPGITTSKRSPKVFMSMIEARKFIKEIREKRKYQVPPVVK